MKHEIKLPQASLWLLSLLLSRPGWAETEGDQYRGSKIAFGTIPDLDVPVEVEQAGDQRAMFKLKPEWCKKPTEIVLTDRGRDTCKLCIKSYITKKALASGEYTLALMDTFGLAVEDEEDKQ